MSAANDAAAPLKGWQMLLRPRALVVTGLAAALAVVLVAVPTDLIDTPLFSREIPPTWWAWPSLVASGVLAGALVATYVGHPAPPAGRRPAGSAATRGGYLGGVLTYLAVGCPVCNKLALVALGSAGAVTWFAPFQPFMQAVAIALLVWALRRRLSSAASCPVRPAPSALSEVRP